jgi:hypothetical protein
MVPWRPTQGHRGRAAAAPGPATACWPARSLRCGEARVVVEPLQHWIQLLQLPTRLNNRCIGAVEVPEVLDAVVDEVRSVEQFEHVPPDELVECPYSFHRRGLAEQFQHHNDQLDHTQLDHAQRTHHTTSDMNPVLGGPGSDNVGRLSRPSSDEANYTWRRAYASEGQSDRALVIGQSPPAMVFAPQWVEMCPRRTEPPP